MAFEQRPAEKPPPRSAVRLVQVVWWLAGLLVLGLFIVLIPLNYRATLVSVEVERSAMLILDWIPLHTYTAYLIGLRYLAAAGFIITSIAIYWRRADEWVAVLVAISLVLFPLSFNFGGNVEIISPTNTWGNVLRKSHFFIQIVPLFVIGFLGFVFPDGQYIPPWTRRVVVFGVFIILLDIGITLAQALPVDYDWDLVAVWEWGLLALAIFGLFITSIYSQIHRYRKVSTPLQRQQTKLVLFGFLLYLQWSIGPWWWALKNSEAPLAVTVRIHLDIFLPIFLPLTIGLSILRFRLWDINVIIRRTLIYGGLTGTLAGVYLISVVLLQRLLPSQSQFTTVFSTLLIAALFNPLRHRIQRDIDRRFYRRKYDAEQTLAVFHSTTRAEVDLNRLSESLLAIVDDTMQPEAVSLWLRMTPD